MSVDYAQELKDLKQEKRLLQAQLNSLYVDPSDLSTIKKDIPDVSQRELALRQQLSDNQQAQTRIMEAQMEAMKTQAVTRRVLEVARSNDAAEHLQAVHEKFAHLSLDEEGIPQGLVAPQLIESQVEKGTVQLRNRHEAKDKITAFLKRMQMRPYVKYPLVGTAAIMGGGKTEFLRHVCKEWAAEALGGQRSHSLLGIPWGSRSSSIVPPVD